MRWKPRESGVEYRGVSFAWIPIKLHDGTWVLFEWYAWLKKPIAKGRYKKIRIDGTTEREFPDA